MAQAARGREQQQRQDQDGGGMVTFAGFSGLNTRDGRTGIADDEMSICDGFFPAGRNLLRILPDKGAPLYTSGGPTVVLYDFANIGIAPYCIIVLNDGSIVAVNTDTLAASTIAAAGTITAPARPSVALTQWGAAYVLIVANQTDGYWVWDGTTFAGAGGAIAGGTVPTGIKGYDIAVYQSRVWIADGSNILYSAPGSFLDFSTASGGGAFAVNESTLRLRFIKLVATNGYLYCIGDSSVSYIAGVQTVALSGGGVSTTFTFQNADPEVGTPWAGTVDVVGSNIIFANPWGVHVTYGGRSSKVSDALDGIYNSVNNFGGITPSAAKAIIFGRRVWMLLLYVLDSYTGNPMTKLFLFDPTTNKWSSGQQSANLTFVQHQENESVITAYGTDGTTIWPLFRTPGTTLAKVAQSKSWQGNGGLAMLKSTSRVWGLVYYYSAASPLLTLILDSERGSSPYTLTPEGTVAPGGTYVTQPIAVAQNGCLGGFTIVTNAADMALLEISALPTATQYRG